MTDTGPGLRVSRDGMWRCHNGVLATHCQGGELVRSASQKHLCRHSLVSWSLRTSVGAQLGSAPGEGGLVRQIHSM